MGSWRGFLVILGLFLCDSAWGRRGDDWASLCRREPPGTNAPREAGDNGFRIKIAGQPPPERYTPGQTYTVSINGSYGNQLMLGFMLVAVPVNAQDESMQLGTFQHLQHGATTFAEECPHMVTHQFSHPRPGVEMLWTAPSAGSGCVEFRATIIEYEDIWYKDEGSLTKVLCEEENRFMDSDSFDSEETSECCACGTGKYQMTFEGLWSRQTHPKDWPSYKRLLHWSNVVGASHSKDYKIWEYGGFATDGIKKVCEFGFSTTLEEEMRRHSRDVRTVVKTPGIYWTDTVGLKQSRWARFSVDRKKHMLTMLTMMGPSPDWCVGVSALDLCLSNCSWAGDMVIDLYPFDAGTDDGITYMSQNDRSEPQQRIVAITSENAPASSPFSYTESLKPLATLTLHRIYPKQGVGSTCTGNTTIDNMIEENDFDFGEDEDENEDHDDGLTDMERKELEMARNSGKCMVSDWFPWSVCSVTCGIGERVRKRMFKHPMGSEDMCRLQLMEVEQCRATQQLCESVDDECAMGGWSDWSPCSVTCGKGVRERRRYYLQASDADICSRQETERAMCVGEVMDCMKVQMTKNFTAICSLPMDVGPCRGFFMRWYYDVYRHKCVKFPYGGCRGNNNRFRTMDECDDMCLHHMNQDKEIGMPDKLAVNSQLTIDVHEEQKQQMDESNELQGDLDSGLVDCMITEWSQWSDCSSTCGKAKKTRQRMIKREAANGGQKCPKKLSKTRRCPVPKCPIDCVLGPWSDWSPCSQTCGNDSIQERARQIMSEPRRGGRSCDPRLERRFCSLPHCRKTTE